MHFANLFGNTGEPAEPGLDPQTAPPRRSSKGARVGAALRNWTEEHAAADMVRADTVGPRPKQLAPAAPLPLPAPVAAAPLPSAPAQRVERRKHPRHDSAAPAHGIFDFQTKGTPNYYEDLQISPRADCETIRRVYRILAARFHPDNPVSGDHKRFLQLNEAYEVLSHRGRRTEYDAALAAHEAQPLPIFGLKMFVAGVQGETNRRLGVMALLYQRRRTNQTYPGMAMLELENRMALPREHLEFTLWYLRSKGYLSITEERSDYALTADGVDQIESHSQNRIVRQLLMGGAEKADRSDQKHG